VSTKPQEADMLPFLTDQAAARQAIDLPRPPVTLGDVVDDRDRIDLDDNGSTSPSSATARRSLNVPRSG
jgi:hypothetical protein